MDSAPLNTLSPTQLPTHEPVTNEPDGGVYATYSLDSLSLGRADGLARAEAGADALGRTLGLAAKRLIDLVGAVSGLALLAPILAAVALLIRLDSPGPIFFRQKRLGKNGRPFWIFKFRTMRADAEQRLAELEPRNQAAGGVLFKIKDDPRVTPLGQILRRTNIDELPQLWNVLRGEMSLVGPRPLQMRDCERLKALDAYAFVRRLDFPPGVTGAWQVGRVDPTDSGCLLDFDLDYIERWSLALDLYLLVRTVFVVAPGFRSR